MSLQTSLLCIVVELTGGESAINWATTSSLYNVDNSLSAKPDIYRMEPENKDSKTDVESEQPGTWPASQPALHMCFPY